MPGYVNSEICPKTGKVHRVVQETVQWYCTGQDGTRTPGIKSTWPNTILPGAKLIERVYSEEIPSSSRTFDNDPTGAEAYTNELMAKMLADCDGTHRTTY